MGPEKTPYLDTFDAVRCSVLERWLAYKVEILIPKLWILKEVLNKVNVIRVIEFIIGT